MMFHNFEGIWDILKELWKKKYPTANHEQQHETTKHFKLIAFS